MKCYACGKLVSGCNRVADNVSLLIAGRVTSHGTVRLLMEVHSTPLGKSATNVAKLAISLGTALQRISMVRLAKLALTVQSIKCKPRLRQLLHRRHALFASVRLISFLILSLSCSLCVSPINEDDVLVLIAFDIDDVLRIW